MRYYEILGLKPECSQDEVKKAFRKLASVHHPDKGGDAEKFKEINEAYQTLSDTGKRAQYDVVHARGPFVPPGFDSFWDSAVRGSPWGRHPESRPRRNADASPPPTTGRGDNIHVQITLSLEESLRGCKKRVNAKGINRTEKCKACDGSGGTPGAPVVECGSCAGHGKHVSFGSGMNVRDCGSCNGRGKISVSPCKICKGIGKSQFERELDVQIPSGVTTGDRIRLSGQGCPGTPPGDLFIELIITNNPNFTREGVDLHTTVEISLNKAVLGGDHSLLGPDGQSMSVTIVPGTQPGDTIVVHGRGVVSKVGGRQGNLIIHLKVKLPKTLTPRAKKLLEELAAETGDKTS